MLTLAFAVVSYPVEVTTQHIAYCYQLRIVDYEDYSERDFDGINNSTIALV